MKDRRNMTLSTFVCEVCGAKIELPRRKGKQREVGHIKDIYCFKCKDTRKHDEIRYNDFRIRREERKD